MQTEFFNKTVITYWNASNIMCIPYSARLLQGSDISIYKIEK